MKYKLNKTSKYTYEYKDDVVQVYVIRTDMDALWNIRIKILNVVVSNKMFEYINDVEEFLNMKLKFVGDYFKEKYTDELF